MIDVRQERWCCVAREVEIDCVLCDSLLQRAPTRLRRVRGSDHFLTYQHCSNCVLDGRSGSELGDHVVMLSSCFWKAAQEDFPKS